MIFLMVAAQVRDEVCAWVSSLCTRQPFAVRHFPRTSRSLTSLCLTASTLFVLCAVAPAQVVAQSGGGGGGGSTPPPPPAPSQSSTVGQTVTSPKTGNTTTVTGLVQDPAGTPTAGTTAFVETAEGNVFLVKSAGDLIYNDDGLAYEIVSISGTTMTLDAEPFEGTTTDFSTQPTQTEFDQEFVGVVDPGTPASSNSVTNTSGVERIETGKSGDSGRAGALFVPPTDGKDGDDGPAATYNGSLGISTTNKIGIDARSLGGKGGKGGASYLSFWDGADGGDGGDGGPVTVTNQSAGSVTTTGTAKHGIFGLSRSGKAGDGGDAVAAPGGGGGGGTGGGGTVTVTNQGTIETKGLNSHGIYGLSVSGKGGDGGSQWGLVGSSGGGGFAADGGVVRITNSGVITTNQAQSHGILAQSIGGSGGSAGISGNLLVSLVGSADNGGDGSRVEVTNSGTITTNGTDSRAIMA
ncbi:MAG: hypothetical protein AAF679_12620, partial [Pseudomonadota bacterium]